MVFLIRVNGRRIMDQLDVRHPVYAERRTARGLAGATKKALDLMINPNHQGTHGLTHRLLGMERLLLPSGAITHPEMFPAGVKVLRVPDSRLSVAMAAEEAETIEKDGLSNIGSAFKLSLEQEIREGKQTQLLADQIAQLSLFELDGQDKDLLVEAAKNAALPKEARYAALLVHADIWPKEALLRTTINERAIDSGRKKVVRVEIFPDLILDRLPSIREDFLIGNDPAGAKEKALQFRNELVYALADGEYHIGI